MRGREDIIPIMKNVNNEDENGNNKSGSLTRVKSPRIHKERSKLKFIIF
jgi:hypothetical protein